MMRRFPIVLLAAVLLAMTVQFTPADAAPVSCSVAPDPVVLGADFTFHATGLTPGGLYVVDTTQPGNNQGASNNSGEYVVADAAGTLDYTRSTDLEPTSVLVAGQAKEHVSPHDTTAQGTCSVWFTVSA
jgi:hypothetical protein